LAGPGFPDSRNPEASNTHNHDNLRLPYSPADEPTPPAALTRHGLEFRAATSFVLSALLS